MFSFYRDWAKGSAFRVVEEADTGDLETLAFQSTHLAAEVACAVNLAGSTSVYLSVELRW